MNVIGINSGDDDIRTIHNLEKEGTNANLQELK